MTDNEKKKLIRKLLKKYKDKYYLHLWKIYPVYSDEDMPYEITEKTSDKACYMVREYANFDAYALFNLDNFDTEKEIDEIVKHELVHLVLMPYDSLIETHAKEVNQDDYICCREQITEHLTRILLEEK